MSNQHASMARGEVSMDPAEQTLLASVGRRRDRETIQRLAPAIVERKASQPAAEELFEDSYSRGLIEFWLVPSHWLALVILAEGTSQSEEAERLQYEWSLLANGIKSHLRRMGKLLGSDPPGCLCDHLHHLNQTEVGGAYPPSVHTRGGSGDAAGRSQRVVADLEQAVDSLPLSWRETRRLYAVQQRSRVYYARYQAMRTGQRVRDQDRLPEPPDARQAALTWLATALGWRQRRGRRAA